MRSRRSAIELAVFAAFWCTPMAASAIDITVTTTTDTNSPGACVEPACTLREAFDAVADTTGTHTVTIAAGVYTLTNFAPLYFGGDPTVEATFVGAGPGVTIIDGGGLAGRINNIISMEAGGAKVTFRNMTIRNGRINDASNEAIGGAGMVAKANIHVVLDNVTFENNHATQACMGGAVFLQNTGTNAREAASMAIYNSRFLNNSSESGGGAIGNYGAPLVIERSTFVGNHALEGGAIHQTEAANPGTSHATLLIDRCVLRDNQATSTGSAIMSIGDLTIVNSTLTGNLGSASDGVVFISGLNVSTNLFENIADISFSTIASNSGGLIVDNANKARMTLTSNIISGNAPCDGAISSGGYNFFDAGACAGTKSSDIIGGDAQLQALSSDGTFAIGFGSLACDAGAPAPIATDQRGSARPNGPRRDIGAYEATSTDLQLVIEAPSEGYAGLPMELVVTVFNAGAAASPATLTLNIGGVELPSECAGTSAVVCEFGSIAPGETLTRLIKAVSPTTGIVDIHGALTSPFCDGLRPNNDADVSIEVISAPPAVVSVEPSTGTTSGGVPVTITGSGFAPGATVAIAGGLATNVVVQSATTITCITPPGASSGDVDVTIRNVDGQEAVGRSAFSYYVETVIERVGDLAEKDEQPPMASRGCAASPDGPWLIFALLALWRAARRLNYRWSNVRRRTSCRRVASRV